MKITLLTIFPGMCEAVLQESILGRARKAGTLDVRVVDIRPFSEAKHKNTDDYPFGGGAGMLMTPQPIAAAFQAVCGEHFSGKRIFLGPCGVPFDQKLAEKLSREEELVLLCGHYEGVDQRVLDHYIDLEISLGDFILTGGELAALAVTDCIARLLPGVLGSAESAVDESFSAGGLLEYPQYTKPAEWNGLQVPEVLISGNHQKISEYRKIESLRRTRQYRPDLYERYELSEEDKKIIRRNHLEDEFLTD